MESKWHCAECGRLLGKEDPSCMDLRYKESQYVVRGADYTVTAYCPRCSAENERSQSVVKRYPSNVTRQ
jgi:uncharacterized protein YchJ